MDLLITHIKQLLQVRTQPVPFVSGKEMEYLPRIDHAYLLIENGRIRAFGPMDECPSTALTTIRAEDAVVMPAFCDSHTHLVFSGSREIEYIDKIRGLSYEEIAKRGGGIIQSAARLRAVSEDQLLEESLTRIQEIMEFGTGAVEIKSGYGLNTESELKMLRVIRRLKQMTPLTIRSTFLGAHAVPDEFKGRQNEYVNLIIEEMLPAVASEQLADYVDVFCDRGFFTVDQTERILEAALVYGLQPKIHANELDFSGGIQIGVKNGARSVDHLEYTGSEEIKALMNSGTMPTLLPGAAFFLGMKWPSARQMIEAGLPVALASDFNPGSSPSGNMKFILSLGCIALRMLPEEVINATTLNGAYAMGVETELGSIMVGKRANVIITKPIPGYEYLPYAYTSHLVKMVILNGEIVVGKE